MNRFSFVLVLLWPIAAAFSQGAGYSFGKEAPVELGIPSSNFDPRGRGGAETQTPARMILPADAVVVSFSVSTESSKPEERLADLRQAYEALNKAVEKNEQVALKTGFMALPLARSGGYLSSMKSGDEVSSFEVTVVAKLAPEESVFERMLFLNSFVERIVFPKSVKAYFQSSSIALLKPDGYRTALVKMVGADYQFMRSTFGEGVSVKVTGLDQRTQVRVVDDRHVEVSLPYKMEVVAGKRGE
ncbi:hypothetical protein VDG1235_971 [Verrucomicrobiia bacterium DG1235]|nr:hypothetical protein VDG1235_971 [Verrucomicrobiae bacterium DG1235]